MPATESEHPSLTIGCALTLYSDAATTHVTVRLDRSDAAADAGRTTMAALTVPTVPNQAFVISTRHRPVDGPYRYRSDVSFYFRDNDCSVTICHRLVEGGCVDQ
jgi:hypothetical protein